MSVITLIVDLSCYGETKRYTLTGRNAWALRELILAGDNGCTPIDNPAPAWTAYVQKLRAMGFDIETIYEPHGGLYKGRHGRYVSRDDLTIFDWTEISDAA